MIPAMTDDELPFPVDFDLSRFGTRWRLAGFGLFNVWKYAHLNLFAPSGRVLLRGPNGTGKTTALEALWPYLLDLNRSKMKAGNSRTTTLTELMRVGRTGDKRVGYLWMTLDGPGQDVMHSYGVRLVLTGAQKVKVEPFYIPGRPMADMSLLGPDGRSTITTPEAFSQRVTDADGRVFQDEKDYVDALGAHVFGTGRDTVVAIADLERRVRNPAIMAAITPTAAAAALRAVLPGVPPDEVQATADALGATEATREAFEQDRRAAELLGELGTTWAGYATDVAKRAADDAQSARTSLNEAQTQEKTTRRVAQTARAAAAAATETVEQHERDEISTTATIKGLESSPAYEYAQNLEDLGLTARAMRDADDKATDTLRHMARNTAARAGELREEAERLAQDVADVSSRATAADPQTGLTPLQITCTAHPHAMLKVGDQEFDQGALVNVSGTPEQVDQTRQAWTTLAQQHEAQGDLATMMRRQHSKVEKAKTEATDATKKADESLIRADASEATRDKEQASTDKLATQTAQHIIEWARQNTDLTGTNDLAPLDDQTVMQSLTDGAQQLLDDAAQWSTDATRAAERIAATAEARARQLDAESAALTSQAAGHREHATRLRSGQVLPPPRPEWAGPVEAVLADALTWHEHVDAATRATIEAAMSASGMLGAALTDRGLIGGTWQVSTTAPPAEAALSQIIAADPEHPQADIAAKVLARITLTSTATDTRHQAAAAIGTDGSFHLGVLTGQAPAETIGDDSKYIGAAQRRAAALAKADQLDATATELENQATTLADAAVDERDRAGQGRRRGASFPKTTALSRAESGRSLAARVAVRDREAADTDRSVAETAVRTARDIEQEWKEQCATMALPSDPAALDALAAKELEAGRTLRAVAADLVRHRTQMERLHSALARARQEHERLPRLRAEAQSAYEDALQATIRYEQVKAERGSDIATLNARLTDENSKLKQLRIDLKEARGDKETRSDTAARAEEAVVGAERLVAEREPTATIRLSALASLMAVPEVIDAVLHGVSPVTDDTLIDQVLREVDGATTSSWTAYRKAFERVADQVRGRWTLDPANAFARDGVNLETYLCTHDGQAMTPTQAATTAITLAEAAAERLTEKEDAELQDFILDRLPRAIGKAWIRMGDWIATVNGKMGQVSASSGVGVRIKSTVRDDLSPVQRTVYELACKKSAAVRTAEENRELARAIRTLLDTTDEEMTERVKAAVDIAQWLNLEYHVRRGSDETMKRWTTKGTGLSTGEARLVTMAPMLASLAALHDGLPPTALRLIALDEVPSEVDEEGRQGLARYTSSLDLDLVCTSHSWDGAPGAWDGIDIFDLEPLPSGTVAESWMPFRATDVRFPRDPQYIEDAW